MTVECDAQERQRKAKEGEAEPEMIQGRRYHRFVTV
jgi:hypothetical protein